MNENSPICASAAATAKATGAGRRNPSTITSAASGLPIMMIASVAAVAPKCSRKSRGSNSMPTETKKRTAKASRIGSASAAARKLNSDRPTTIPARNAPRAIDTPKKTAEPAAMPSATTSTVSVKSSRECVAATRSSSHGITRPPSTIVRTTSTPILTIVQKHGEHDADSCRILVAEDGRQHDQHDDREQILDDQPADGDMTRRRMQVVVVHEDAREHDGAGDGNGESEHNAGRPPPAEGRGEQCAEDRGDDALADRAGYGDFADGQEFLEMEMQPDAEHEQNDADLGQLLGQIMVGDEAGGIWADCYAGQQIADDRRQAEPLRDVAEH